MRTESELEIYIHIPFCVKKCLYCDFLSFSCGKEIKSKYLRALINEIKTFEQTEAARELDLKAQFFLAAEHQRLYKRNISERFWKR